YSMVWGIGVALGSFLAGWYWDQFGGSMMFYAAALLSLLAALLMGLSVWHTPQLAMPQFGTPKIPKSDDPVKPEQT
ncbi:MAG: hypothetical protein WA154_02620, partial [Moraxellaceae bacterium]